VPGLLFLRVAYRNKLDAPILFTRQHSAMDMEELEALRRENASLRQTIRGYETVVRLNDEEINQLEQMVAMYERIIEFSRAELLQAHEEKKASEQLSELTREELITAKKTVEASETVSQLSRAELLEALTRIKELEMENKRLKEQRIAAGEKLNN